MHFDKLYINIENCYGIAKLDDVLIFKTKDDGPRMVIIYAPNGTMKSSLAKVFKKIGKGEVIENNIWGDEPSLEITCDGTPIQETGLSVEVFDPLKDEEQTRVDTILVSDEYLRQKYADISKNTRTSKQSLYNNVLKKLGMNRKTNFDIEAVLFSDFCTKKNDLDLFMCISELIADNSFHLNFNEKVPAYDMLFNDRVEVFFKNPEQSKLIAQYELQYNQLLEKSNYLGQSKFDHVNLANINKVLDSNRFFTANGKISLRGKNGDVKDFCSKDEVQEFIKEEKERILTSKELKDVFDKLSDALNANQNMRVVSEFLSSNNELIMEFADVSRFKQKYWVTAFKDFEADLNSLIKQIETDKSAIEEIVKLAKDERRLWRDIIEKFNQRFSVPFEMKISNQHNVIINTDVPNIEFSFKKKEENVLVDERHLKSEILSFGEVRALKTLNMLFKVNAMIVENKQCLLVLDDIADSFDYKNKYAIIEYLSDISTIKNKNGEPLFYVIILSHNFDFYRTVSARLNLDYKQRYFAMKDEDNIVTFTRGEYTNNVFAYFRNQLNNKTSVSQRCIIASIPFVRNLIEYKDIQYLKNDGYNKLTSLLHLKKDTMNFTLGDILELFQQNWDKDITFDETFSISPYWEFLFEVANSIENREAAKIEDKIVLSIAIRLKTEKYLIKELSDFDLNVLASNQTKALITEYKKKYPTGNEEIIRTLDEVLLMTSENIHFNSFMFEPILDMSMHHLYTLYRKVSKISDRIELDKVE